MPNPRYHTRPVPVPPVEPVPGVALIMSVYPLHADLVKDSVAAIEKYWPQHPLLSVGPGQQFDLRDRLLADVSSSPYEYVVLMHEDFRLCGPVKQDLFDHCLAQLQQNPALVSCSLTWEPSDVGPYHYPKEAYAPGFQVIPVTWDYVINFQMRIWKRAALLKILSAIPSKTSNSDFEPLASRKFRILLPNYRAITYAFPDPKRPSTFVDETDKRHWIIPYDNLIHAGQRKTALRCPVYINNRDRLNTTREMVRYLKTVPGAEPIIIDNASTYPPLLDWYATRPVQVVRLDKNIGPHAPWLWSEEMPGLGADYYVVTDSDLDLNGIPRDLLDVLRAGLIRYPGYVKVGLSLEIDDLPARFESSKTIRDWESKFWKAQCLDNLYYVAAVDTTFAMYRTGLKDVTIQPALRAGRPYTARHVPWYRFDSEEERYYASHADLNWATWSAWDQPVRKRVAYAAHLQSLGVKID